MAMAVQPSTPCIHLFRALVLSKLKWFDTASKLMNPQSSSPGPLAFWST